MTTLWDTTGTAVVKALAADIERSLSAASSSTVNAIVAEACSVPETPLIVTVEAPDPPSLLVLGSDALGSLRRVLDAQRAELDAWEPTSLSTDYPA